MSGLAVRTAPMHYDPDCSAEQLDEVHCALERWSSRTAKHVTHYRASDRHPYRSVVTLEGTDVNDDDSAVKAFHVPARNISKTGLGLLAPAMFVPRLLSDATPLVHTETVFQVGLTVKLTLAAKGEGRTTLWGQIVRMRPVHHGFFEIGIRFIDRDAASKADVPNPLHSSDEN